jgi:hypothetical protein
VYFAHLPTSRSELTFATLQGLFVLAVLVNVASTLDNACMDRYEFSANYSEDLVRRSVRRHFPGIVRHEFSWRIYVAVAVTGGALVYR